MNNEQNNEQARVLNEEELKGVNGGLYVDKLTVEKRCTGQCPGFALENGVNIGDVLPVVGLT